MKKCYTVLLFVLGSIEATNAQTLTDGTNSIQVGDVFTTHRSSYLTPGSSGANVIWDFSTLSTGTIVTYTHEDPAVTGFAGSFPASTVAQQLSTGEILFVQTDASGMQLWGEVVNSEVHAYSDAERFLSFPCSYGTAWVDDFEATFNVSGVQWVRNGTISATADGYGSLVMPYGTVDNVLRVSAVQTTQDVYTGGEQLSAFNVHYFYRVGVRFPVVVVTDGTVTTDFGTFPLQFVTWLDQSAVGVADAQERSIGVDVFPNPANVQVNVVFWADGSTDSKLEVVDAAGRTVHKQNLGHLKAGVQQEFIEVSAFAPGIYTLCITDGKGGRGVKRLVVE